MRNQGNASAAATTLRYYRSSNATIFTDDTEVGTDAVRGLAASEASAESISLTAPSGVGTYYYGACVDAVADESDTGNNCSAAVTITVSTGTPPVSGTTTKLYWTDWGTAKIQRSNLDGSGVEDLVTGLLLSHGIALGFGVPIEAGGGGSNLVPLNPSLNAWINASDSEGQRLLDQATICRAGLEFRRDTFCVNERKTILVGHLSTGEGLVIVGRSVFRAGESIRLQGIVLVKRDDVPVLTQFSP